MGMTMNTKNTANCEQALTPRTPYRKMRDTVSWSRHGKGFQVFTNRGVILKHRSLCPISMTSDTCERPLVKI